ncbi:hypothetical protein CLV28_1322 [Sediminihabitans luteus]|uniref:Uncharacterized protein n=1 Tax=Sediminihabitans luteus TaxID=1138585 RepID=A0A2M9CPM5_9CELL|nr:hypothetical protein [Sediminihabitans luteus]PJJ73840.1 hypothetical protein CLV28_1322 [Sediminihabitans luteus]GII98250.1 hypothetical protein Slu03_06280 [Sediminihabitans luteus]
MNDLMARLSEQDPARRLAPATDGEAWGHVRDELLTATGEAREARPRAVLRRRRPGRRTGIIAVSAFVLVGAGTAFAVVNDLFASYPDSVVCTSRWGADGADEVAVGPLLTGDVVEDCEVLFARAGLAPIDDPVAFSMGDTYVAPADQVPEGATILDAPVVLSAEELELHASIYDFVDGANVCRSVEDEAAWFRSELERLGLADRTTVEVTGENSAAEPCARVDGLGPSAEVSETYTVRPADDPESIFIGGHWRLAADLREQITGACLSLEEARAVADAAIATYYDDTWPTTSVVDESASCARVDASTGGNVQVTVYGPTVATP